MQFWTFVVALDSFSLASFYPRGALWQFHKRWCPRWPSQVAEGLAWVGRPGGTRWWLLGPVGQGLPAGEEAEARDGGREMHGDSEAEEMERAFVPGWGR